MNAFLMPAITGILTALIIGYLNKSARKKVRPTLSNHYVLRLHKFYWYFGIGSILLGLVGFIAAGLLVLDANGWVIGLFFLLLFGGLGFLCAIWYINHSIHFNNKMIQTTSVFKKKTVVTWDAISSVEFKATSGLLVFTDIKGQKAKAHQHLVGFNELLRMMEAKTSWEIKNLNLPFKHIKH